MFAIVPCINSRYDKVQKKKCIFSLVSIFKSYEKFSRIHPESLSPVSWTGVESHAVPETITIWKWDYIDWLDSVAFNPG